MPFSTNTFTYSGGEQTFTISLALGYIKQADIQCFVVGELDGGQNQIFRAFTFDSEFVVRLTDPLTINDDVTVQRTVDKETLDVDFEAGGDVTPRNLMILAKQSMMSTQEILDGRVAGFDPVRAAIEAKDSQDAAAASAAAALVSEGLADADAVNTAADVVTIAGSVATTAADVVLTNADVVTISGSEAATTADAIATAADAVSTGTDATTASNAATAAGVSETNAGISETSADSDATAAGISAAEAAQSAADAAAAAGFDPADFVAIAGGTMLGSFKLSADATLALEPVSFQQWNAAVATPAEYLAKTTGKRIEANVWDAAAVVVLTYGVNVSLDMALVLNGSLAMTGNATLDNPTNVKVGQSGFVRITQDATGSRTLAYGSAWTFAGGTAPDLSTAANAVDVLIFTALASGEIVASLIAEVS